MKLKLEIPELTEFANGFPAFWVGSLFLTQQPTTYQVRAVVTTYIRLVESAMVQYRQAREFVYAFWNHGGSLNIGATNLASSHFEACLTNMHRAGRCLVQIRRRTDVPQDIKALFPTKPRFIEDRVAERVRNMRDATQHTLEQVQDGTIPENTPFMIHATGHEQPIPEEPGQTLKTIDRLQIGHSEIRFDELTRWLLEMAECAQRLADYYGQTKTIAQPNPGSLGISLPVQPQAKK